MLVGYVRSNVTVRVGGGDGGVGGRESTLVLLWIWAWVWKAKGKGEEDKREVRKSNETRNGKKRRQTQNPN